MNKYVNAQNVYAFIMEVSKLPSLELIFYLCTRHQLMMFSIDTAARNCNLLEGFFKKSIYLDVIVLKCTFHDLSQ